MAGPEPPHNAHTNRYYPGTHHPHKGRWHSVDRASHFGCAILAVLQCSHRRRRDGGGGDTVGSDSCVIVGVVRALSAAEVASIRLSLGEVRRA